MPAPYDYSTTTGYARARADWEDWPSTATLIRQVDIDRWDQALNDKKREVFNVKDFQAVGDGVNDDTAEIQAAITAANTAGGGVILFPPGTYNITASLDATYNNLHFLSLLPRKAVLKATASMGGTSWGAIMNWIGASSQVENTTLEGLVFDANAQATTPTVRIAGVLNFRALNCVFKGTNFHNNGIGGAYVSGGTNNNFTSLASERLLFRDCEFGPSGDSGLSLHGGTNAPSDVPVIRGVTIENCYVHDCQFSGIANQTTQDRVVHSVRVTDCRFENNGLGSSGTQRGHLNDETRNGFVDLDVSGCYFGRGNQWCGGVSDHCGRDIRIHHNHFEMGATEESHEGWWIAIGDDRTFDEDIRSWFVWVHHNFVTDCAYSDLDSSNYMWVTDNIFYRNADRPLALFGRHFQTFVERNHFIENSVNPPAAPDYHKCGVQVVRGTEVRRNIFRDAQLTRATLSTALTGTDNDLDFIAREGGTAGNSIRVRYVDPGAPNAALSVSVSVLDITVNLATNGSSVITSTAAQVRTAVNTSPPARFLVRVNLTTGNDGDGVVTALAFTSLASGSSTPAPTQLWGAYELSGDPDEGQGGIVYKDNDFGNSTTPVFLESTYDTIRTADQNTATAAITVASATTVSLPAHSDVFSITGTTTITSVTAAPRGRRVTLVFAGVLTFTDGSNLKLAGNFVTTADDAITLVSDGTNWFEVGRSVN